MTRVVLCGFGRFGRVYAQRVMDHADMELVGVVELADVHDAVRAIGVRPFDSLGEAVDVTHPQLVIVATPPEHHALLGIYALNRYCDVMLAKPGALGIDQADRLIATAENRGRRIVMDYTPRMASAWRAISAMPFHDGILTVRMVRRGVQALQDCGALWDLAPHDVAMALDLQPDDDVVWVSANAWHYPDHHEPVGVFVFLQHASGRSTRIEVDWMAGGNERRVEIVEHERMTVWDQLEDCWGWTYRGYRCDDRGGVIGVRDLEPVMMPNLVGPDNVTRALSRAIAGADDCAMLWRVTRILEAAERSMLTGSALTLDGMSVAA